MSRGQIRPCLKFSDRAKQMLPGKTWLECGKKLFHFATPPGWMARSKCWWFAVCTTNVGILGWRRAKHHMHSCRSPTRLREKKGAMRPKFMRHCNLLFAQTAPGESYLCNFISPTEPFRKGAYSTTHLPPLFALTTAAWGRSNLFFRNCCNFELQGF